MALPKISMNVTTTFYGNVVNDIALAKEAGYTGIELQSPKFYRFLDAGFPASHVRDLVGDDLVVTGFGAVQNTERPEPFREDFLADVTRMCEVAAEVGAPIVQLCTGPEDWTVVRDFRAGTLSDADRRYRGTLGLSEQEAIDAIVRNVKEAASIAADHGVGIFLEPLAWTNVPHAEQLHRILDAVNRDNVGIAVDFWHFWCVGDTPEDAASFAKEQVYAVHVSDGTKIDYSLETPNVKDHRNIVNGGGDIPLQEWVDAVKSTGYDGWWVNEMFSEKANEHDMLKVAKTMRGLIEILTW